MVSRRIQRGSQPETLESRALLTTLTVTTLSDVTADDGDTTLREAIVEARTSPGEFDVVFAAGLSGTIELTEGIIDTRGHLSIDGGGDVVIDGGGDGILNLDDNGTPASLTLRSLTLQNASNNAVRALANLYGGHFSVTLDDVLITGATARNGAAVLIGNGGQDGIARAALTVRDSMITGNAGSGVAANAGVDVLIEDSEITENGGTGFTSSGYSEAVGEAEVTIRRTLIDDNSRGGVQQSGGDLLIEDSRISNNRGSLGAGVYSYDPATIRRSTITGNVATGLGGGVYMGGGTIENSTLSGNQATTGGGAMLFGTVLSNSTITGNTATQQGGGVYLYGSDPGVDFDSNIIAGNLAGTVGDDIATEAAAEAIRFDNNLLGSNDGTLFTPTGASSPDARGNLIGGSTDPIDAGLMDLTDVGLQQVHALAENSPAIDRGSNTLGLQFDQLGSARLEGSAVDIGAVEGEVEAPVRVEDRVLIVTGTPGNDSVEFQLAGSNLEVTFNQQSEQFALTDFDSIEVRGGDGDDLIIAKSTPPPMLVEGNAGADTIKGGTGADTLLGNDGNDKLRGTNGNDQLDGGAGDDSLLGQGGDDTLVGGDGKDTLNGNEGSDIISGGSGDDSLKGGTEDDDIQGGDGDDIIAGEGGNDTLRGEGGDDRMRGGGGNDLQVGGLGNDKAGGGNGRDTLIGDAGNDYLNAGTGSDQLVGGDGDDTLRGREGDDVLDGGSGDDFLKGLSGLDVVYGGEGADTVLANTGEDIVVAGQLIPADGTTVLEHLSGGLRDEWLSSRTYDQRVENIRDGAGKTADRENDVFLIGSGRTGQNVFDDGTIDEIRSGNNLDLFFARIGGDVFDREDPEFLEQL